jgi:hypothetical protein
VIPRVCVEGDINHNVRNAHESKIISLESVTAEDVSAFNSFWLKQLNISLVLSPPKDPVSLSDLVSDDTVIDLDADYFADLQNECYIPRIGRAALQQSCDYMVTVDRPLIDANVKEIQIVDPDTYSLKSDLRFW